MAIQKMDQANIDIGPAWIMYKGLWLGATQGGPKITAENTSHEVKTDQTGEEVLAEIYLGGTWMATVPLVEINLGVAAAIVPGAVAIAAAAAYVATDAGATYAAGVITFSVAITGIKVGDICHYTKTGPTPTTGVVGQFDIAAKKVYLMDGAATPDIVSPSPSLYHVNSVKFHNATGVNLLDIAGELMFVPKDPNDTNYYIMPLAGLVFKPELNFISDAERLMSLEFKSYARSDVLHSTYATGLSFFIGSKTDYDAL